MKQETGAFNSKVQSALNQHVHHINLMTQQRVEKIPGPVSYELEFTHFPLVNNSSSKDADVPFSKLLIMHGLTS